MREESQPQLFLNVRMEIIREHAEHYASFTRFLLAVRLLPITDYRLLITSAPPQLLFK